MVACVWAWKGVAGGVGGKGGVVEAVACAGAVDAFEEDEGAEVTGAMCHGKGRVSEGVGKWCVEGGWTGRL